MVTAAVAPAESKGIALIDADQGPIRIERVRLSAPMRKLLAKIPGTESMTPTELEAALREHVKTVVLKHSTFIGAAAELDVTRHTLRSWLERMDIQIVNR